MLFALNASLSTDLVISGLFFKVFFDYITTISKAFQLPACHFNVVETLLIYNKCPKSFYMFDHN